MRHLIKGLHSFLRWLTSINNSKKKIQETPLKCQIDSPILLEWKSSLGVKGLRNKFHFSDIRRSMSIMGLVAQEVNFAQGPLRSYFDKCQENEIHLFY